MRLLSWLITNTVALAVALWIVPGIRITGPSSGWEEIEQKWLPTVIVAIVLGVVTSVVKPVMTILSIPFIILTLGLFLLVVNAAVLGLTSWLFDQLLAAHLDHTFHVDGFWAAVLGGLIIAIVGSFVRSAMED